MSELLDFLIKFWKSSPKRKTIFIIKKFSDHQQVTANSNPLELEVFLACKKDEFLISRFIFLQKPKSTRFVLYSRSILA